MKNEMLGEHVDNLRFLHLGIYQEKQRWLMNKANVLLVIYTFGFTEIFTMRKIPYTFHYLTIKYKSCPKGSQTHF